jgi:hypothetical protein
MSGLTLPEPTNELCSFHNPELWSLFCLYRHRPYEPSYVWTEAAVVDALKYLEPKS